MPYSSRRDYERFTVSAPAVVNTDSVEGISTSLTDVSAGGAGLLASVPFDPLQKVEVLIKACSLIKQDIKKAAKVAWCRKAGYNLWRIGLDFGADNLISFS